MSDFLIGCGLVYLGFWKMMRPNDVTMDMIKNPSQNSIEIIVYLIGMLIFVSGVMLILDQWSLPFTLIQISPIDPDRCTAAMRRIGNC